jgi:hypothetical protein
LRELAYRLAMRQLPLIRTIISRKPESRSLPLIVSLTTTPKRLFQKTDIGIATLLSQRCRPDRVILWLSDEVKDKPLPKSFDYLCEAGLEVQYRRDVGPHTKLLYALQEHPDSMIVSADDDMLYPANWLGALYASYQRAPKHIHCHRAHLMRKDSDGKLTPYKQWARHSPGVLGPSHLLFPTGVGGVLYPPRSLAEEVFHVDAFQQLCPFADDVWFKAMALLQGVSCQKVKPYWQTLLAVHGTQQGHLFATNIENNDAQVRATFDAYDLYRLL